MSSSGFNYQFCACCERECGVFTVVIAAADWFILKDAKVSA